MMGIVSDSDFEQELDKINGVKPPSAEIVDIRHGGRGEGNVKTPEVLRKIISESAIEDGNQSAQALASVFGISKQAVHSYKNGALSCGTYNKPDEGLRNHNNKIREKILEKTQSRLEAAIDHITDQKLAGSKARDLAGIARDMSAVVRNLEPEKSTGETNNPLVIFAPMVRKEENYDVIVVNE